MAQDALSLAASVTEATAHVSQTIVDKANEFRPTRRATGAAVLGLGAMTAIDRTIPKMISPLLPSRSENGSPPTPPQSPEPPAKEEQEFPLYRLKELYEWKKSRQAEYLKSKSREVLNLEPTSKERAKIEYAMFEHLKDELNTNRADMSDILLAMEISGTVSGRNYGMDLIWQARQSGVLESFGMKALDQDRIQWAKDNKIDPRILAIAGDVRSIVLQILMADPLQFLEQGIKPPDTWTEEDRKAIELKIPNAGMIAMLMMTETNGYLNVGTEWAIQQLNPEVFPSGPEDLKQIAKDLSELTGFDFTADNIIGSDRGDPRYNLSGGAIGPQFMPLLWRVFQLKYNFTNSRRTKKFPPISPNDPIMGTMMSTLYLSSYFNHREGLSNGKWVRDETTLRIGYEKEYLDMFLRYPAMIDRDKDSNTTWENHTKLYKVISKWNPWHPQIIQVIEAAVKYEKTFPKKV